MSQHCKVNPCFGDVQCSGVTIPQDTSELTSHNNKSTSNRLISFRYRNHKGIEAIRRVEVESLDFEINPGYGYQPGWFISGICQDKHMRRSFALSHIVLIDNTISQTISLRF